MHPYIILLSLSLSIATLTAAQPYSGGSHGGYDIAEYHTIDVQAPTPVSQTPIHLYPNPLHPSQTLKLEGLPRISNETDMTGVLYITDLYGRMHFKQEIRPTADQQTITLTNLPLDKGLYFVRYHHGDTIQTYKLLVR